MKKSGNDVKIIGKRSPYNEPRPRYSTGSPTRHRFVRNPSAALKFADAVDETIQMLCRSPNLGERFRADLTGQIRFRTI